MTYQFHNKFHIITHIKQERAALMLTYVEMQCDSVIKFFTIELRLTLTFRMGQGQMQIHQSKANRRHPMYWQCNICPICHCLREIRSKFDFDF